MKVLVGVKRVVDYAIKIRVKQSTRAIPRKNIRRKLIRAN